jgi:putative peptidoglycan lipid II flippase
MVKKILLFVSKEISGLHEAAYLLALSSVASLVFAVIRDRLLAHMLGAGTELDVYYAAFRIPDFIFVTVASLVSTSILVPFLVEAKQKGAESLKESIQHLFSSFLVLIVVVCALAAIFMEPLQQFLFPALFTAGYGDVLVSTSRVLLLSPILLGFASFFASLTHIQNRFLLYAISSPLYNIGIIGGIIFFLPRWGVQGLAWGVACGALLLSLAQIPVVIKDGLFPRIRFIFAWSKIKTIALLSVPRTVTLSSQQCTYIALVSFASFLGAGSISIFNFALNLQSVPLSIIGASYSSAAFPVLARLFSEKNTHVFTQKMVSAARHVVFWAIPLSVLFIVLRAQIVRTVLGSGEFSWSDTRLTAAALALFVVSAFAQSLTLLFVRSFYAEGKTAKPLLMNLVSMVVTIVLAFVLLKMFNQYDLFRYFVTALMKTSGSGDSSVLMLPLAFSVGAFLNLLLHWVSFSRAHSGFSGSVLKSFFHTAGASIIGGYTAYLSLDVFDNVFNLSTVAGVFFQGLLSGIVGTVIIVAVLHALKSVELRDVLETLHRKIWKVDRSSLDQLPS